MHLALFAIDVWLLVLACALLLWSQAIPGLVQRSRYLGPEARARKLFGYALAPWAIAWLTVALTFAPTWLAASGWVGDWCLSRHAGSVAACPMHGAASDPDPLAPLLAILALLLSAVALIRAGWMVHLAISIARRLGMVQQRSLIVDGLRVDVVAGDQAGHGAVRSQFRVVVSEQVVLDDDQQALRAQALARVDQLVGECDALAAQFGARAEPLRALSKWVADRAHAAAAGVKSD